MNRRTLSSAGLIAALASGASPALCQTAPSPPTPDPSGNTAAAPRATDADALRFRGSIAGGAGGISGNGFAAGLGSVDGRIGVQLTNALGVYAQPHFSYGRAFVTERRKKDTGVLCAGVLADYTFADRFFVGGGAGFGAVNSASGPQIHLRAGAYPLMRLGEDGSRRKGLMLGIDLRVHFLSGGSGTFVQPMASIGYEAF